MLMTNRTLLVIQSYTRLYLYIRETERNKVK